MVTDVPLAPGFRGFEYGCGTGLLSFALSRYLSHMTMADSSRGMLAVLEEKIASEGIRSMTVINTDLMKDALPQEKYNVVYTLMTLHHIIDTENMLHKFYTLLTEPGYLCVADLDVEDGSFHGSGFEGHCGFARNELGALAQKVGFTRVRFRTIYTFTKPVADGTLKRFPIFLMIAEKE